LKGFNDLRTINPDLASEALDWDPSEFLRGSNVKQNWICKNNHTWAQTVKERACSGYGCPVCNGKVLDVAVDIRVHSKTYGKYLSFELSAENGLQLWIPEGFAHGFVALEDNSLLSYKCTNYYNKNSEDAIVWNDPLINIVWKVNKPILSDKDESAQNFSTFESPF
jgi:dTDP-4-dehydrorhamnose 3,5-epimerase